MKRLAFTAAGTSTPRLPHGAPRGTLVLEVRHVVVAVILLIIALFVSQAAAAQESGPAPAMWGDFGIGYGNLDTSSAPYGGSNGALLMNATIGGRINNHVLLGLEFGGAGAEIGNCNGYYTCDRYSDFYGQLVSDVFVTAKFEPGWNQGWAFGLSAGRAFYHNKYIADLTGNYRSGEGNAGKAYVGYDWRFPGNFHVEAHLSFETGNLSLDQYLGGSANYHAFGLTVHAAYH